VTSLLSSSTGTTLLRAAADNRLVGSSSPPFSANSPELAGILARVLSPQSVDWISRALSVGVVAPKATPAEIIDKLNQEINAVVADPKMKGQLVDLGVPPMSMTPAEFGKLIVDQTEKWAKVIKFANVKAD
jgi:hypothetical protein